MVSKLLTIGMLHCIIPMTTKKGAGNMNSIGDRIAILMKEEKLSQKELARMAGVTEAALSRYLKNERQPKVEILANIATSLNTTSDYLINGKTNEKTEVADFAEIYRFVARGAKNMDKDEKMKLMRLLLDD